MVKKNRQTVVIKKLKKRLSRCGEVALTERKAAATKFDGNKFLRKEEEKQVRATENYSSYCCLSSRN